MREKVRIGRKTKFGAGDDDEDEAMGTIDNGSNSSKANSRRSSASAAASAIPPIYSVPKIYVSDDGTLYLDKILQLATGEQQQQAQQQREEEAAKSAAIAAAQRNQQQQPMPEGAVTEHPLARLPLPSPPPAVPAASMDDSAAVASPADSSASPAAAASASPVLHSSASPPSASATAASALSHLAAAYAATSSGSSLPASSIPTPPQFTSDFHPLLILIPLRLGVDKLNPSYIPSLLSLFQFPACVGIMGGKPRSSLYFIGVQDAMLFYLDPHTVQKSVSLVGEASLARGSTLAAKHAIASSYHCASIQSIPVRDIDPSMALGFYIESRKSLDHFWEQAKQFSQPATLAAQAAGSLGLDASSSSSSSSMPLYPVFHVAEVSPQYSFDDSDDDSGEEGDESDGVDGGVGDGSERSGSGSELDEFPDALEEEDEAGGEFAKARAAMPPWPAAALGQPQEREMTIFKRLSIDADGDAEEAAEAKRDEEGRRSESPVSVNVGSLPKDAAGRPLNMDSLTSSPVLCPQGSQHPLSLPVGGSPANSLAASDSMEFHLGPTAESGNAAASAGAGTGAGTAAGASADSAEPSGAVASLSHLTYAALGSFSSFTAAVASTASQQLAAAQQHIANGAASLHAQASALRKGSSEAPDAAASAAAEEAAVTAALVAAYSAPVPAPAAADSSSAAASAAPSPASAAPAASSSAASPAAAASAATSTTPASAPVRRVKSKSKRKSSKAAATTAGSDGDDDWSIL